MSKPIVVTNDAVAELYRAAFNQVCNKEDWKAPIDCVVPYDLANLYMQAIEFMTGVRPDGEMQPLGRGQMYRLTCCGYRNGPCGDF